MKKSVLVIGSAWLLFFSLSAQSQTNPAPRDLAQLQLDAYNAKDIEGFLSAYSDSVEVFTFPNQLQYRGIDAMRKNYAGFFQRQPNVRCEVVARIAHGQTIIDHERLTGFANVQTRYAVAIYEVALGKIQKVYFVRE
jgi:hypothetical protein